MPHKLEFRAHLIAHTLCVLDKQPFGGFVVRRAAQRVKAVRLERIQRSLPCRAVDRAVAAAREVYAGRDFKGRVRVERGKVGIDQISRSSNADLFVHQRVPHVDFYIKRTGSVHVCTDNQPHGVAPAAAVLCRGKSRTAQLGNGFCGGAGQAVQVRGFGVQEKLAQREHGIVHIGIAENIHAVLLQVAVCNFKHRTLRAPCQRQGNSSNAAIRQGSGCFGYAGKIDIRTGQNLVLGQPGAAAVCHIYISFSS